MEKVPLLKDLVWFYQYFGLWRAEGPFDSTLSLYLYEHGIVRHLGLAVEDDERILRIQKTSVLIADLAIAVRFRQMHLMRPV